MKISHILIILGIIFIFMTQPGCHVFSPGQDFSEQYRQGELYAMQVAREDAISDDCFNPSPHYRMRIFRNKKKHLGIIKKDHSPYFISGFSHNYAYYFNEYMNLYCGN